MAQHLPSPPWTARNKRSATNPMPNGHAGARSVASAQMRPKLSRRGLHSADPRGCQDRRSVNPEIRLGGTPPPHGPPDWDCTSLIRATRLGVVSGLAGGKPRSVTYRR
eukprot:5955231-Pyramimonas_sp.AAC.1